jgi:hypothetical protein
LGTSTTTRTRSAATAGCAASSMSACSKPPHSSASASRSHRFERWQLPGRRRPTGSIQAGANRGHPDRESAPAMENAQARIATVALDDAVRRQPHRLFSGSSLTAQDRPEVRSAARLAVESTAGSCRLIGAVLRW